MKNNNLKRKIVEYFDDKSEGRDVRFQDPVLGYEQKMRQKAVIELLDPHPGELILDVGCGNARDIMLFAQRGAIPVGADFSNGMIRQGKEAIDRHFLVLYLTRGFSRQDISLLKQVLKRPKVKGG